MTELATEHPASGTRNSELQLQLEDHRREIAGYCYRMLGSTFETDDAVQETMVRAWRELDRFEAAVLPVDARAVTGRREFANTVLPRSPGSRKRKSLA